MTNDALTIILAALTAFFTLITGALAIAITIGILYFKKLASDRQREISDIADLKNELAEKILESEKTLRDLSIGGEDVTRIRNELEILKKEYFKINDYIRSTSSVAVPPFSRTSPYDRQWSAAKTPGVSELQDQISALLSQIYGLQRQLSEVAGEGVIINKHAKEK